MNELVPAGAVMMEEFQIMVESLNEYVPVLGEA